MNFKFQKKGNPKNQHNGHKKPLSAKTVSFFSKFPERKQVVVVTISHHATLFALHSRTNSRHWVLLETLDLVTNGAVREDNVLGRAIHEVRV